MRRIESEAAMTGYEDKWVRRGDHPIFVRVHREATDIADRPSKRLPRQPPSHLYDRLVVHLSPA